MNLVDSSAWIAYFFGTANATFFSKAILKNSQLLVPTICLYEVFKKIAKEAGTSKAMEATAQMKQGQVISISEDIALQAAVISLEQSLAMADSLIYASAQKHQAWLWTQDKDFQGLPKVRYQGAS